LGKTLIRLPPEKWKTYTPKAKGYYNPTFIENRRAKKEEQQEEGKTGRQQMKHNPQNRINGSNTDLRNCQIFSHSDQNLHIVRRK
jgi:hypothetical protein